MEEAALHRAKISPIFKCTIALDSNASVSLLPYMRGFSPSLGIRMGKREHFVALKSIFFFLHFYDLVGLVCDRKTKTIFMRRTLNKKKRHYIGLEIEFVVAGWWLWEVIATKRNVGQRSDRKNQNMRAIFISSEMRLCEYWVWWLPHAAMLTK